MKFIFKSIGVIRSPFTEKDRTPIQASRSQAVGQVELYPEFADGLKDIEAISHIYVCMPFTNRRDANYTSSRFWMTGNMEFSPPIIHIAPTRLGFPSSGFYRAKAIS